MMSQFNRGAGGRQDFGGRRSSRASADRRVIASPGSMPPPAWLIRSNPNANDDIVSIAVQPDGKILVGRRFQHHRRTGAQPIARLDPMTGLADSFNPNANNAVRSIAVQADGKILAGGISRASADRRAIASRGSMPQPASADSFNPNANNSVVLSIAVQADGKILAGGSFIATSADRPRNYIARLDPATGLADSFDPNANSYVSIQSRCRRTARF